MQLLVDVEHAPRGVDIFLTGVGEYQLFLHTVEQRGVQLLLELEQVAVERGAGDIQFLRRVRYVLTFGDLDYVIELFEIHAASKCYIKPTDIAIF